MPVGVRGGYIHLKLRTGPSMRGSSAGRTNRDVEDHGATVARNKQSH
jgi:hypothetical protein